MKKLMLVLVPIFLFGSNVHAQNVDWSKFIGAREIIDDMETSGKTGMSLEDAVESKWDVYSKENTAQLLAVAGLDDVPLAKCDDYLSKAKQVIKALKADKWDVSALEITADATDKKLSERPRKHLVARLYKQGLIEVSSENPKSITDEVMASELRKALLSLNGQTYDGFLGKRVRFILGTEENDFKDGLLYVADELIEKGAQDLVAQVYLLRTMLLCDQYFEFVDQVIPAINYSVVLANIISNGLTARDFSVAANPILEGMVGEGRVKVGLKNFNKITELVTVTNVIEK